MNSYDCLIVGAGISGLSAAYELHQRGASLLVVEARSEPGGSIRSSQTASGFIIENGPNTVVSKAPELDEHFANLGITEERVVADRRGARRYVLINGRLELLPMSPPAFLRSPILSTPAKLRMFAEPLLPPAPTPDESVAMFFSRRLGPEIAQNLVDPFVSGIYAGDPHELSMQSTFPMLWEAEQDYGSVVRGMIMRSRTRKKPKGPRRRSEMLSFRTGLNTWPQAIVRALGSERVWLNTAASGLQRTADGWQLTVSRNGKEETLHSRQIVLAVPADVVAKLLRAIDASAAQSLDSLPYSPVAIVHLGYRRADVEHPLDGFGMLCPSREGRRVLGTLWPSSLFPDRAPADAVLTTSFVGGARRPHMVQQDEEELIETVMQEQRDLIGARGEPIFTHVERWPRAISQYVAGHAGRESVMDRLEAMYPGLHLVGNFRQGVSVEKCWHNGRELGLNIPLARAVGQ